MSKNTYIIIIAVAVIVVGGFLFLQSGNTPEQTGPKTTTPSPPGNGDAQTSSAVVTYTDTGYSPKEVAISQGGTVTFQNESSRTMWPATAIHPTHTIYPGSGIFKCITQEQSRIFDACEGVDPGESWSFSFQELGSWGYHDHLNISSTGKIIVQ